MCLLLVFSEIGSWYNYFLPFVQISMSKVDAEHGELLLYQNMVLREAGRTSKALEHLIEFASLMHDKLVVREIKGIILQVVVTLIRVIPKQMLGADNNYLCPGLPLRYVNAESLPGKDPITDNIYDIAPNPDFRL